MSGALKDIGSMFGGSGLPLWSADTGYYLSGYAFVFLFALIGATPIVKNTVLKIKSTNVGNKIINVIEPIFVVTMLIIVTSYFVDGSFSPFLYFRF
jgi:alginate O-acetyltransferase complex protein AlgI